MSMWPHEMQDLIKCDHFCHERGLNPWVAVCPVCGCVNPNYDPNAQPDFEIRFDNDPMTK